MIVTQNVTNTQAAFAADKLTNRGIETAAKNAGWIEDGGYWRYPVYDYQTGNIIAHRKKRIGDGGGPKYRWHPAKPDDKAANWYVLPGTRDAIREAGGVAVLANGEPALLAYWQAGIKNVIATTLSEVSIPGNAAGVLADLGISRLINIPDYDDAGRRSAAIWRDRLAGSGIDYKALSLADVVPAKGDANDLWIACGFDRNAFTGMLEALPTLDLPAPERRPALHRRRHYTGDDWPPEFVQAVTSALLRQPKAKSRRDEIQCVSPFRNEDNPSFNFSTTKLTGFDFATGQGYGIIETGQALGIDIADYRPDRAPTVNVVGMDAIPDDETARVLRVDVPYVTMIEDLPSGDLAIKSDMGTGKTTLIKSIVDDVDRVLTIGHRRSLARMLGETYELHYEDANPANEDRVAVIINSLHKLVSLDAPFEPFDVVVIDEIEQLIAHLGGGTFKRATDAERAYSVLKHVLKTAGRVIVADAHLSPVAVNLLRNLRGDDLTLIDNAFYRQRGKLSIFYDHDRLIETVVKDIIPTADKPVFISTGSKGEAKRLEALIRPIVDDVLVIHSENSGDDAQQAFIRNPDEEIENYRVVIASPSVGTGVDIQTEVSATVGIFYAQPLDARDCHQAINRTRNTEHTLVYVQNIVGNRETDAATIYHKARKNALETGAICQFDKAGYAVLSPTQEALQGILSRSDARRNASMNYLYKHFVALAQGYEIEIIEGDAQSEIGDVLDAIADDLAETEKAETLEADPVDAATYEQKSQTATGDERLELDRGFLRWKIEKAAGRDITPDLYDHLKDPTERGKLYLLSDVLFAPTPELKNRDQRQHKNALHRRRHYTRRVATLRSFFQVVLGIYSKDGTINPDDLGAFETDKADLEDRVAAWLLGSRDNVEMLFNPRKDASMKPLAVARRMLSAVGLELKRFQKRDGDELRPVYRLCPDRLAEWADLAKSSRKRADDDNAANTICNGFPSKRHILSTETRYTIAAGTETRYTPQGDKTPEIEGDDDGPMSVDDALALRFGGGS